MKRLNANIDGEWRKRKTRKQCRLEHDDNDNAEPSFSGL